jgi:hypothetical protein
MKASNIDWKSGRVVYWDMESVDLHTPLAHQLSELKEDLAQISYPSGILVDIGWYPELSEEGAFLVTVVKHENWETPLMKEACSSALELVEAIKNAIRTAEQHVSYD